MDGLLSRFKVCACVRVYGVCVCVCACSVACLQMRYLFYFLECLP